MILKANDCHDATCALRAIMATGHAVRVAVYAQHFRTSERIVVGLAAEFGSPYLRGPDEIRACWRGNTIAARPTLTGDVIETLAGEHPDVVLVVTEYLDGDVLAELEKTDEKARADAISCSISHD